MIVTAICIGVCAASLSFSTVLYLRYRALEAKTKILFQLALDMAVFEGRVAAKLNMPTVTIRHGWS